MAYKPEVFCIFVSETTRGIFIMAKLIFLLNVVRRYKYLITVLAFVAVAGFLDDNSYIRRLRNKREIFRLEKEIEMYQKEYDESTRRLNELMENADALEKVAREKYFMKKSNEDIYIIE